MLSWLITGPDTTYQAYFGRAQAFEVPGGMLAVNLGIASLIPITFVVIMIVHRVRPRWLGSVGPGLRWNYLLISLGIAAVALAAVFALSTLVGPEVNFRPQDQYWIFLIIILLTSPLQAAGEEYLFRGYLLQAIGSVVRTPWFGVLVSSLIFALFHGTQNLPLFFDRLAFGLLAAILVYRTGGIEAPIAAHVINNVYAFGIAGLTGTIAQARGMQEISWVDAAFDVGGFALFAALAWLAGRRLKLQTTT
jgi:membrane protease YdiL (CAAX protease family)